MDTDALRAYAKEIAAKDDVALAQAAAGWRADTAQHGVCIDEIRRRVEKTNPRGALEAPMPDAATFGLTPERLAFFHSDPGEGTVASWLLPLTSLLVLWLGTPFGQWVSDAPRNEPRWLVLVFLFPLPGIFAAVFFQIIRERLWASRKTRQPDWPAFQKYIEAVKEYNRARWDAKMAAEKAREEAEQRKRKQVAWWQNLDGYEFERELTKLFRARGLTAYQRGGSGDGGVDIELKIGDRRVLVQCKAHKTRVSPGAVRDLYGTLLHSGADEAWLVTTVGFNPGAEAFAAQKPIRLLTIATVLEDSWRP